MLLDTDVLVDLLRKLPSAMAWLGQQSAPPGVPGFAAMELLWGCQNRANQRQIEKWLLWMRFFPELIRLLSRDSAAAVTMPVE